MSGQVRRQGARLQIRTNDVVTGPKRASGPRLSSPHREAPDAMQSAHPTQAPRRFQDVRSTARRQALLEDRLQIRLANRQGSLGGGGGVDVLAPARGSSALNSVPLRTRSRRTGCVAPTAAVLHGPMSSTQWASRRGEAWAQPRAAWSWQRVRATVRRRVRARRGAGGEAWGNRGAHLPAFLGLCRSSHRSPGKRFSFLSSPLLTVLRSSRCLPWALFRTPSPPPPADELLSAVQWSLCRRLAGRPWHGCALLGSRRPLPSLGPLSRPLAPHIGRGRASCECWPPVGSSAPGTVVLALRRGVAEAPALAEPPCTATAAIERQRVFVALRVREWVGMGVPGSRRQGTLIRKVRGGPRIHHRAGVLRVSAMRHAAPDESSSMSPYSHCFCMCMPHRQ